MKIYKDRDANLRYIKGVPIAIIGYGSQGRAQALNLKDNGLQVIVGLPRKSKSVKPAQKDGFGVYPPGEAAKLGQIISVLAPDHLHKKIYSDHLKRSLSPGKTLLFACGFSIYFKLILPPEQVDIVLVAPHAPGDVMRTLFVEKKGVPCFVAVQQDYSGKAQKRALAYSKAIGCTKAGAIQTSFRDEAIGDLFGEQAVLCGGLTELLKAGFEVLVQSGLSPENAYLECVHQLDFIVDTIKSHGIAGMFNRISKTAEYGSYIAGRRIIDDRVKNQMTKILREIEDGSFARRWMRECESGMKNYLKLKRMTSEHPIEGTGKRIRDLMK